jgi:hypothetical protein
MIRIPFSGIAGVDKPPSGPPLRSNELGRIGNPSPLTSSLYPLLIPMLLVEERIGG